jgi:hypothetical protein
MQLCRGSHVIPCRAVKRITTPFLCCSVIVAVACGGSTPPPSPPPAAPAKSASSPNRPLSRAECQSLGELIVGACHDRPNERSSRVEGWCGQYERGMESGSFVQDDCAKHVRYMDAQCFQSATNVHAMMDCDTVVDRP